MAGDEETLTGNGGEHVGPSEPDHVPREIEGRDILQMDERLREAITYIHNHMGQRMTVEQLIRHIGVSRRWLEYAFRDALGRTPYQYIRRRRLELARNLLRQVPPLKVYEIARRTGFSSAKQLTMAFRREFGVSPRGYRRSLEVPQPSNNVSFPS
ncbi:MAG: helix-turn-helix domain-containing protein [Planctomycetales bacterium]|nr:helix-turn-helix domain-containing protein [Planctomycetales bacterium]